MKTVLNKIASLPAALARAVKIGYAAYRKVRATQKAIKAAETNA